MCNVPWHARSRHSPAPPATAAPARPSLQRAHRQRAGLCVKANSSLRSASDRVEPVSSCGPCNRTRSERGSCGRRRRGVSACCAADRARAGKYQCTPQIHEQLPRPISIPPPAHLGQDRIQLLRGRHGKCRPCNNARTMCRFAAECTNSVFAVCPIICLRSEIATNPGRAGRAATISKLFATASTGCRIRCGPAGRHEPLVQCLEPARSPSRRAAVPGAKLKGGGAGGGGSSQALAIREACSGHTPSSCCLEANLAA